MREVLAPCGGIDGLTAALNSGADAVYIGLKQFSARKNAENFSDEDLALAAGECHKRGVKLYVTFNTLVYDCELAELAECIIKAARAGVDGLIIQDLGAARLAERICPELPRHASTQMTLNSVCGVKAAEELGFSRVVIGRELSGEEIAEISRETDAQLEVFVHGALCVCVSGQCYMSSIFGGRSGNRGLCAQPCRLDFTAGERHNVISLKDSSLIPHLNDEAFRGVYSYKIEGRMKRPEYVACAVDACRKSLSGIPYDKERLEGIFSRGGLTDSYFDGTMSDMCGIRGKEDVENSAKALNGIKELYKAEFPRIKADISVEIREGEPISAAARCRYGEARFVSDVIPESAKGAPLDKDGVCARISKLGGTQFYAGEVLAAVGDGLYVSAAALNSLRRELCAALENVVSEACSPKYKITHVDSEKTARGDIKSVNTVRYRAEVADNNQLEQALSLDFEMFYAPMGLLSEDTPEKERIAVIPPLILSGCEREVKKRLAVLKRAGFSKGLAHTLGHARLLKECGFEILGGYRMNILNSLSAGVCVDFGFSDITLSFEGAAAVLAQIGSPIPEGILAYGRIPLMLTRRCPLNDGKPCGRKDVFGNGESCGGFITDRQGNRLPVLCGGNSVELLNPDLLIMSDKPEILEKFDFAVMKFTAEDDIAAVLDMYKRKRKPEGRLTRGLYFRGAQ
ncbi:MAG: U32 family peptidase [Oscillospiraceae bacterium]|nr:U32 family peptidase [Oscillospiraceae bacterium]